MPKAPGKKHRGAGRVAFLARIEEIKQMVSEGHPLLSIYEKHQAELGTSYSQFARYVAKYVRSTPTNEHPVQPPSSPAPVRQQAPAVAPQQSAASAAGDAPAPARPDRPGRPKPFDHDPSSAKRDDLI